MPQRSLKSLLGQAAFEMGLHERLLRDRAIVVLFHRVDDRLRGDSLSCSRAEFAAFCDFFKEYFDVISMTDLVARMQRKEAIGGRLVITFDDGYRDNYEVAAGELTKRGLPCCFFVATNFIESTVVPWWDAQLPVRCDWMTWDEVRKLDAAGFEIGSHTMNHADLGKVSGDEAVQEIRGSRERLERELGHPVALFSYPYGRPEQITAENLELVRAAGYSSCVSAFGGRVAPTTDIFRMRRMPISPWVTSPFHLGFEMFRE